MTKIKLSDGTIINASTVEVVNGVLKITTSEHTVEELAELFSDKEKTAKITLLTESGVESGYKEGFTNFAGIYYTADGEKTVELLYSDPIDTRISCAEAAAEQASEKASEVEETVNALLGAEG